MAKTKKARSIPMSAFNLEHLDWVHFKGNDKFDYPIDDALAAQNPQNFLGYH